MSDDGWRYSSEGDLDPDLTEEAGYSGWEPRRRPWLSPTVFRLAGAVVLASFVLGVLRVLL